MQYYPMEYVIRDHPNEHGILYDDAGNILWMREGDSYHVEIDDEVLPLFKDNIFTHNHPGNSPISPDDLELACLTEMRELRVTTIPYLYSLKPAKEWGDYDHMARRLDAVGRELGLFNDEYNLQYMADYYDDEENVRASCMEEWRFKDIKDWNRVWRKVSKECGLVFKSWLWR